MRRSTFQSTGIPRTLVLLGFLLLVLAACGRATPSPTAPLAPPATGEIPPTSPADTPPTAGETPASGVLARNPSHSSPISISEDDSRLVVANTLDGSISVFDISADANARLAEIETGALPRSVAISPDVRFVYVTNGGSGRSQSSTWARWSKSPTFRSASNHMELP